ncbi:MAG TPA: serine/threonine-protein kinase [Pirellulales bacterium]|jgi:serine/threonine-protein kinase|nr:serine/threonine-protein kinase [Pirellulales bacterium]
MDRGHILQGRYQIEEEVGRGSFGVVYRALDQRTGEAVAVKVLLPWASQDAELRHRLKREAELAGRLHSPHAVRTEGLTDDGQHAFVVMEFLDGHELARFVAGGPLAPNQVEQIARQTLDVLGEAHALGVVHRDIKPHNLFICRAATGGLLVKVFDFGIAKIVGGQEGGVMETTKLTVSGGVLGTPAYMSPEQCRGDELTPASDLYSLGIVLYEALTGHVPFEDPNPVRMMMMHLEKPVPPLPAPVAAMPLGRAVMRALEKDLNKRFQTASEFFAALDAKEAPPPASSPAPALGDREPAPAATAGKQAADTVRRPWKWALVAAVLVAIVVVTVAVIARLM